MTEKLYWTTPQLADRLGISQSKLRYWASYFGDAEKRKGNHRRFFNREEVAKFERVKELVMVEGFTLEGAKIKLKQK